MATNKHLQNRINHLISLGIPYPQAIAIANSEIPTMLTGGGIDPNYLQNLEAETYDLDEEYRLLQSERDLEWAKGLQAETDRRNREEAEKYDIRNQTLFDNYMEEADSTIKNSDLYPQQNGLDLNTEELKKLFNPYAGYSMEDALMGMGRFIGGDRSFGNALGFIKAPISGARTFMSGMGLARREKDAREKYEEEQRRGLVGNYKQDGGRVSSEEIENITGIRFSEEAANNLFERRTQNPKDAVKRQIELGGYKGRNFFNIQDQESNVRFVPTKENPQNHQGYKSQLKYLQKLNPNIKIDNGSYLEFSQRQPYSMQEGGAVRGNTFEDIMRYARAVEGIEETEEEILFRRFMEYLENNKENLPTINRKTEDITPEEMQRIEEEKMIREHFYQTGGQLTFPERMTGEYIQGIPEDSLEEPVVELEDGEHTLQPDGVMSEVKGKKHSQGGEKLTSGQIQDGTIVVSDHLKIGRENAKNFNKVYDIKVKASDTYATVIDKIKSKVGLDKINKEQEKLIEEVQKQERSTKDVNTKNINLEFLSEKINQLEQEKQPLEEVVKQALVDVYNVQESEKSPEEQAPVIDQNLVNQTAQQYNIPEEQAMGIVQEYLKGGQIPKMQDGRMYNIYGKDMIITSNGLVQKLPEAIPNKRASLTTHNPEHLMELNLLLNPNISKQEKERLLRTIDKNNNRRVLTNIQEEGTGDARPVEITDNTQTTGTSVDKEEATQERRTPVSTVNSGLPFTKPNTEINTKPALEDLQRLADSLPEVEGKEDKSIGETETGSEKTEKDTLDFFQFPDQSVSPPDSIRPPLKGTVRLGRADAYRIDPAQALAQNQRNFDAQMAQIGNLPPAQRAAAQAALLAEKNSADNQVINMASMQNAQITTETDRFNLQRSDLEEQLALQNALSYEDKIFKTQAAYDANLREYYNYMRDLNVARFNDVRNQNMANSLFENYEVNPDGSISVKPDSERFFAIQALLGKSEDKKKKDKNKTENPLKIS